MDINGQNWSLDTIYLGGIYPSTQRFDYDKQFTITSSSNVVIDGIPYQKDAFGIFLKKKQLGKQTIFGAPFSEISYNYRHSTDTTPVYGHFYTMQQNGEFICEDFEVDKTKSVDNWIEITKEEGNFKKIWGKFNINFQKNIHPKRLSRSKICSGYSCFQWRVLFGVVGSPSFNYDLWKSV